MKRDKDRLGFMQITTIAKYRHKISIAPLYMLPGKSGNLAYDVVQVLIAPSYLILHAARPLAARQAQTPHKPCSDQATTSA